MSKLRERGFTLIEMLVVIGIIAVLAAIIIPVYSRAQERARQADCTAHLHAIGIALRMYRQEHHAYPSAYNPVNPTHPGGLAELYQSGYLSNFKALRCPDDPDSDNPDQNYSSYDQYYNYLGYQRDAEGTPCTDSSVPATAMETVYTDNTHPNYIDEAPAGLTVGDGIHNERNQLIWDASRGAAGMTSAFPGLINRNVRDEVAATRCPHHRNYYGSNNEKDITLYVGGDVTPMPVTGYDWVTQPIH